MSKSEFFHSTPTDVNLRIQSSNDSKAEKLKFLEYQAWLTGYYVAFSIASNFSNKTEYPKNPLVEYYEEKRVEEETGVPKKTKEEMEQEMLYISLCINKANAELSKYLVNDDEKSDIESGRGD